MRRVVLLIGAVIALSSVGIPRALATWSIVGVDPATGEVGVAIASCVPAYALGDLDAPLSPVALAPGIGAGVSQALLNDDAPPEIVRLLQQGAEADAVVAALTSPDFDRDANERQHAVVRLNGDAAGFTGANNQAVAGDRQGPNVSAQGNIVASDDVITDALDAFGSTSGGLGTRLTSALLAGADAGGDSRCDPGQTALFAHVSVATAEDDPSTPSTLLTFAVSDGDGNNPVEQLAAAYADGVRQQSEAPASTWVVPLVVLLVAVLVVAVGGFLVVRALRNRLHAKSKETP